MDTQKIFDKDNLFYQMLITTIIGILISNFTTLFVTTINKIVELLSIIFDKTIPIFSNKSHKSCISMDHISIEGTLLPKNICKCMHLHTFLGGLFITS